MAHPKKLEYTALIGLALQVAFTIVCWAFSTQSESLAVQAETWHLGIGVLMWAMVWVHGRQRRLARDEREEFERLRQSRLSEEIFEETELDTMRAGSGLNVLEKYLVPAFSVVLSGLLMFIAYRVFTLVRVAESLAQVSKVAPTAVAMVVIAFFGFLIGKYAASLAQAKGFQILRAAAGYTLGNVIACILLAVAMVMAYFGVRWGEHVVTYVVPALMALIALEFLLNLVLDIYRPRVPGQERRPPYDSRLLGLFAEPQGVLKTVAATLDYQFGFKVSETWFYHFMERAIVPLLLIQVGSLWLLTGLVEVEQDEVAFIETLGRPVLTEQDAARGLQATVYKPGFYLKWPWPFSTARHVPAFRVHRVEIGKWYGTEGSNISGDEQAFGSGYGEDVLLWRERHVDPSIGFEARFLVPSTGSLQTRVGTEDQVLDVSQDVTDELAVEGGVEAPGVNLAHVLANVHYRVRRREDGSIDENSAFTFAFRQAHIQVHMARLGYRAICRIAASQDFLRWIAQERDQTVEQLRRLLQEAIDREGLGLEIIHVGIPSVHPPAETAGMFEQVVASMEYREALSYEGDMISAQTVEDARAVSSEMVNASKGYAYLLVENSNAARNQFMVQDSVYRLSPMVYQFRTYFDVLEQAFDGQRVYVLPSTEREVQIIDMQERLRPQILETELEG